MDKERGKRERGRIGGGDLTVGFAEGGEEAVPSDAHRRHWRSRCGRVGRVMNGLCDEVQDGGGGAEETLKSAKGRCHVGRMCQNDLDAL